MRLIKYSGIFSKLLAIIQTKVGNNSEILCSKTKENSKHCTIFSITTENREIFGQKEQKHENNGCCFVLGASR
jgi:hypothetical protein